MSINKEILESKLCATRIEELKDNPIKGNFDTKHLLSINEYIFQDLPRAGFSEYRPGKFRDPVPDDIFWYKKRPLKTRETPSLAIYSNMQEKDISQLDEILKNAKPELLKNQSLDSFAEKISDLYVNLDYIHPFDDGNSRTLRTFTSQLSQESGYDIHWGTFNKEPKGRDLLYIARDMSVFDIAKEKIENIDVLITLTSYQAEFSNDKKNT